MWNTKLEKHAAQMRLHSEFETVEEWQRNRKKTKLPAKVAAAFDDFRKNQVRRAKASGVYYPSKCPYCSSHKIIRKGQIRDKQRYRCQDCKHTFGETGKVLLTRATTDWQLMCHRCGESNAENRGPGASGGRSGYCNNCKRKFIQGGRTELDKNGLILQSRVKELPLPADIKIELLTQATLDVLEGRGYCWTVKLDKKSAWNSLRTDSWAGSDNMEYRKAVGDDSDY